MIERILIFLNVNFIFCLTEMDFDKKSSVFLIYFFIVFLLNGFFRDIMIKLSGIIGILFREEKEWEKGDFIKIYSKDYNKDIFK